MRTSERSLDVLTDNLTGTRYHPAFSREIPRMSVEESGSHKENLVGYEPVTYCR
jgi:hypothetical protein